MASPLASSAAMLCRGCPPMLVKSPPTYTVLPLTASAYTTKPTMAGFQSVACPLASNAARWWRACPPMLLNGPPAYTVLPLTASAFT